MIRENSLYSFKKLNSDGTRLKRREMILSLFENNDCRFTDREVLKILFPGKDDMNLVRPRINELLKDKKIEECGTVWAMGRPVRRCRLVREGQINLF